MGNVIGINPMATSNATGYFKASTEGFIQGHAWSEPANKFQFDTGILASTEVNPSWQGKALSIGIGSALLSSSAGQTANSSLGPTLKAATTIASIGGFAIANQNYSGIISGSSNVPLSASGQSVNFARIGSGVKLSLGIDSAFAATLIAGVHNPQYSWDFQAQQIVPYLGTSQAAVNISTVTWATTANGTLTITLAANAPNLAVGNWFTIAGNVQTGGTITTLNGSYKVATINNSTFVITVTNTYTNPFNPLGSATVLGTTSTVGNVSAVGGALSLNILDIVTANSLVVDYNYQTQSGITGNAILTPGAIAVVIL